MALTRRQREVLDVIRDFIERHGYSPSLEEIGGALGLSSVATVHKHVTHLVDKGLVRRAWNQNRSIELVESAGDPPPVLLPLLGAIAAGSPVEVFETRDFVRVPADLVRDPGRSFALRVRGESMIDEHIQDGDLVVVERRDDLPRDGDTVVALVDDAEATLKRYYREAGGVVRLQPANRDMLPIRVSAERVRVQGAVVALIRKY